MNILEQAINAYAPNRGVHEVIEAAMYKARNSTGKEASDAMNTVSLLLFYNKEVISPAKAKQLKDEIKELRGQGCNE